MKTVSLLLLFVIPLSVLSQKEPIKWKEIPMEDLQMTNYGPEPMAPALVLCDYGQIYFNTNPNGQTLFLFYDRHVRIKILNTEGLKYAKISIPFHNMLCEKLEGENSIVIKAMVYNLSEKGELIATKLKNKDIIYRDSTNCMRIAEFTCPDVKPGSIIEYIYQKPTLDFVQPKSWYFQSSIPTLHSELRMRVPRAFQYLFSSPNISNFDISEETNYNSSVMFSPRGYNSIFVDISGIQMRFVKTYVESFNCNSFIAKPEDFMLKANIHLQFAKQENMDYAWKYVTHQLMITTEDDYDTYDPIQRTSISYPAGYIIYKLPDWERFNSDLLKNNRFGLPLITYWKHEVPLSKIIENTADPKDKMLAIYDYLRKNMKWTGEYNSKVNPTFSKGLSKIYTKITNKQVNEKSLAKPFENKKGSSSEINFLLIYFLNKAGIEANPVIISTRDNGIIDENIPELKQFNQVLALVNIDNEQFLLDATDSIRPYNILDINDLNSRGFLVKGKDFGWIPISNNKTTITRINEKATIDTNLTYLNQYTIYENGYEAFNHRKEIYKNGMDKFISEFRQENLNPDFDNKIELININNDTLPLVFSIIQSCKYKNEKEIKIQPNFNPVFNEEDFSELARKYPVDFIYPFQKNYTMEITIPENYLVELPSNDTCSTFGNNAFFLYQIARNENKVVVKIKLQILQSTFPYLEYDNLRKLFAKLNEKLNESIVIRKN